MFTSYRNLHDNVRSRKLLRTLISLGLDVVVSVCYVHALSQAKLALGLLLLCR